MENSQDANKSKLKMWTADEDTLLVDCLLTLRIEQKFMAENGFKPGYANALQTMMEAKMPGCGIKACPHITSRIKTLKGRWQATYDMVYGPNTSGFGWDADTNCVTADKDVWDEYVKVHPKAAKIRGQPFPNFINLCNVWARDRAVGDEGITPGAMEDEVHLEDDETPDSPTNVAGEADASQTFIDTSRPANQTTDASVSSRKKRRLNNSEVFADVLRDTVTSLDKTVRDVFENLGNQLSEHGRKDALEAKGADLYDSLMEVAGLTLTELNAAHIRIVGSEQLLNAFGRIPTQYKASWIRTLLQQ